MQQSDAIGKCSRVEERAWWLARQSGWVLVAGLLSSSVANGLIVGVLVVLDHLSSSSIVVEAIAGMAHASVQLLWLRLHPYTWYGPAEIGAAVAAVVTLLTLIVCGAISLTRVHRHESIAASFHRCIAGLIAITPAIALHLMACCAVVVIGRTMLHWTDLDYNYDFLEGAIWLVPIAVGVLRVTRKMAEVTDAMAGPPPLIPDKRCQDCGYDLSGHIDLPRCGECGSPTATSLTPRLRRFPNEWETARAAKSWLSVTIQVLLSPGEFYARLRMRDSIIAARAFGRMHFVLIGLVAAVWLLALPFLERRLPSAHVVLTTMFAPTLLTILASIGTWWYLSVGRATLRIAIVAGFTCVATFTLALNEQNGPFPVAGVKLSLGCFAIAFAAPLVCWLGQRINGTLAALPFLGRDGLPDGRWAETVIAYESAFCWFFCVGWGLLIWSYFAFNDWISRLFGTSISSRVFGLPPEIAAIIVVALVGGLIWQIRFRIAYRAVRWANE